MVGWLPCSRFEASRLSWRWENVAEEAVHLMEARRQQKSKRPQTIYTFQRHIPVTYFLQSDPIC
jgi:hypothetical protein